MKLRLAAVWVQLLLLSSCTQPPQAAGILTAELPTVVVQPPSPEEDTRAETPSPVASLRPSFTETATADISSPTQLVQDPTQTEEPEFIPGIAGLILEDSFQYDPWTLVHDLAWSPDGSWLAAAAGERVYIYTGEMLEIAHTLVVGAWVKEVQFLPSASGTGWILGLAVSDGTLQFWDITQEKLIQTFSAHNRSANSLAVSPDGRFAASAGNDAVLRLWDLQAVWDQPGGEPIPAAEMIGGAFAVPVVRFSPDGSLIASIDLQVVRLRDPSTTRLVRTLRSEGSLFDMAFSPDGGYLAAAGWDSSIQVWQVETGELFGSWETGEGEAAFLWDLAFDPRGSRICVASSLGWIYLWSFPEGKILVSGQAHEKAASTVAFSPDGERLVTGGLDAAVRVWKLNP